MSGSSSKARSYRFGPFLLDTVDGVLSRNGIRLKLQDLPYRLLLMLVERPGEVISREEVRQRLWPENTFVEFDNSLGVAIRKVRESLNDDADSPHYVETVPRRGYRFVAPVSVVDGAASAAQDQAQDQPPLRRASDISAPAMAAGTPAGSRPGRSYWAIALLVVLLVGGAIAWFRSVPRRGSSKAEAGSFSPPVRVRRSVAVLGFRNLAGRTEDNWLSPALAEMLNTELGEGGGLRMVSGEDVARAKRELPLTDEDSLAKATLERLRNNPGAEVVVLGSYTSLPGEAGKRIRLDIRAQDTVRGDTIAEQAFTGSEEDLFELATQAGKALRQSLGVGSISAEGTNEVRASLPSSAQAMRLYAEGRTKLWAFDFLGAKDVLVKAVNADPNYALAHSGLSEAWWHLGYHVKARTEIQKALELSTHLPQEERLQIEGQYRVAIADWPKAIESYQTLFRLFPDSVNYGIRLASVQMQVKPADALHTLDTLRHLPPPSGDDARIDLKEAQALLSTDSVKAREVAKRGIAKALSQGSHSAAEWGYGVLCENGTTIGDTEAISDCESALASSIAAKDIDGAAMMRTDLAALHFQMGDLARSEQMFREAIREFQKVGNTGGVAASESNLGTARFSQGDLVQAKTLLEEAIPEYQALEDKEGVALALNNLGDLARQSGKLDVAEATYQQARATAREIDNQSAIAYVLTGLGDVLTDRGDLAGARKSYDESLALRNKAGEKQYAAQTQVLLARVSIEEGHAAEADASLQKCLEQFHQEKQADDELEASAVLVQALLAEGKYADAKKVVDSNAALAAKSQNRYGRLQFDLADARVRVASDHPESARPLIEHTLQDARLHGYVGIELEVLLARAELEKKAGHAAAAQAQFSALEKTARSKGFGLTASKAQKARG